MTRRQPNVSQVLLLLLLAAAGHGCSGCRGCGSKPALAELLESNGGEVQGGASDADAHWRAANPGSEFRSGDSIRTDAHASATLRLADGSRLEVHPASLIRFRDAADGDSPIELITGEAVITAGTKQLLLHTHVGLAVLRPGATLRVARDGDSLQLHLDVGEASFRRNSGENVALSRGESVRLEVGQAEIRESDHTAAVPPQPARPGVQAHVNDNGVRSKADGQPWQPLAVGEQALSADTDLSLPAATSVTLRRDDDRAQLLGAGDYRVGGHDLVRVRRGKLQLSARSHDIAVAMPNGWIMAPAADGGSDAQLEIGEREGLLRVTRGKVSWTFGAQQRSVTAGEPLRWEYGRDDAEPAAVSDEEPKGPPSLSLRAGESFVVHAPEVPVVVEFDFARACSGRGLLELNTQKRARGVGHARLALGTDARAYSVRCLDEGRSTPGKIVARGTVRVLRDAGTRDLPPRAPTSSVDADGRSYTIYYQNQLPDVRVRWPDAPSAKQYQLDVDGNVLALDAPEHAFASGSLRDGAHRLTFSANQRRSRTASVEIHFDNTATTASITAPTDRGFAAGASVDIEGVALAAWKVSVDGGTIEKIGEDRFHGQVVTSEAHPDIAVRLAHPRLGTHYYLRRAAGAP